MMVIGLNYKWGSSSFQCGTVGSLVKTRYEPFDQGGSQPVLFWGQPEATGRL